MGDGNKDAAQCGIKVAGGEITAREEIPGIATDIFGGLGLRLFAGMERAELRITGLARSTATRPSAKVKEHKDARSLLRAAAERPTERSEDMEVSLSWKMENRKWTRGRYRRNGPNKKQKMERRNSKYERGCLP